MQNKWIRRAVIGLSCLPLAVVSILHTMGRTGDYGVLGKWYVMAPLTLLGLLGWVLVEKTVASQVPSTPPQDEDGPDMLQR